MERYGFLTTKFSRFTVTGMSLHRIDNSGVEYVMMELRRGPVHACMLHPVHTSYCVNGVFHACPHTYCRCPGGPFIA